MIQDDIAKATINIYDKLPKHGKPRLRDNGIPEWTVLASISLLREGRIIIPVCLGAGVKVLPATKLPPLGDTIHDCHAEILAKRGFTRWIIDECLKIINEEPNSDVLEITAEGKLKWKGNVQVWLYISTLPCGDASTLYTAAHQPPDMALLKSSNDPLKDLPIGQAIRGRNGYESFGSIRTKPGRSDSNPTICMSCSDKIASWNVLGIQGGLIANLLERPVYLDGIVIGGVDPDCPPSGSVMIAEGKTWRGTIESEVERSLYGRIKVISNSLDSLYQVNRPRIHLTSVPFPFAKESIQSQYTSLPDQVPQVQCILYFPLTGVEEVLHNGSKSGGSWKPPGKVLISEKARSKICKYELFKAYLHLERDLGKVNPRAETYWERKQRNVGYQEAKALLRGFPGSPRQLEGFENCGEFSTTQGQKGEEALAPPFEGWIVSGERWESFALDI